MAELGPEIQEEISQDYHHVESTLNDSDEIDQEISQLEEQDSDED
jgi:hypothetical protein